MEGKALILPVIFLIVFLSIPHVKGDSPAKVQILLYEISPYSYSGENMDYVCVINPSDHAVNLSGYFLTDFEGYLQLHGILKGYQKLYVAQNKSSFFRFFGSYPTWSYGDLKYNGTFSLANKGDEIAIVKENQVVDMVVYGNSDYSGVGWHGKPVNVSQGHVLRRINLEDTNSSVDWSNYHRIGQSDFGEIRENSEVELFTYPDDYGELFRFVRAFKIHRS